MNCRDARLKAASPQVLHSAKDFCRSYMTGSIQTGLLLVGVSQWGIPLRPPAASSIAEGVDRLHFFLTGLTLFFTALIFGIIFYFMVKYRRCAEAGRPPETEEHLALELTWTLVPTLLTVVIF